ncbi:cysteine ABC transporter permease/ATP-binding protein CydC [Alicyclobacillus hesperidum URH17-3-68]|uniref:Thiol reductant ABC exporter subunit CydC n=1 Tax=Alicyclobacillus hesperidum TaxID=89784 RepID=A0AA37UA50_9BACL|nr:thiol reductant ABC exporter subunit CydC [Alicyclobacillus hesperidum]EJY56369.1 cysteine ABC transporter permease/ATP-binding protein CydC [Alicyclobacillus hesperidum URH17-3-68]GLV14968.1 thiol reductant ABC exporter subunit CydC [Alicyclobacillus hesperidum]
MTELTRWFAHWLRPVKLRIIGTVGLSASTVLAATAMMATAGYLISAAALHPPTILMLWVPIIAVRFFGTSRAATRYMERWMSHDSILRLAARLRSSLFDYIERHPETMLGRRSSEALDMILDDMERLQNLLLRLALPALSGIVSSVLTSFWLYRIDFAMADIYLIGVCTVAIGIPVLLYVCTARWQNALRIIRQTRTALFDDLIRGLEEIVAHGVASRMLTKADQLLRQEQKLNMRLDALRAVADGALFIFMMATVIGVLSSAGVSHATGHLAGTMLAAVALAVMASFEPWLALGSLYAEWNDMIRSAMRLSSWTPGMHEYHLNNSTKPTIGHTYSGSNEVALSVCQLGCRYTPEGPWAIRGIDFTIEAGQHVAIVGDSGAGKTTLLHILQGIQPWSEGDVIWFGQSISDLPDEELRRLVAAVPQETYIFHSTLRQNLLIARPDANDQELEYAIEVAQLKTLIEQLPEGLSTIVGDRGFSLSGGERQRIALARAILRDAKVIVCDEPTASLDVKTEISFIDAFFTAMERKTVLWVTHRLVGLERMHQILVMQKGRIVETGTHEELIHKDGVYRQLWALQQERFDASIHYTDWKPLFNT